MDVLFLSDLFTELNDGDFGKSKLPRNAQIPIFETDDRFIDYIKVDKSLESYNFFKGLNYLGEDLSDKYLIFFEVEDGLVSFRNLINNYERIIDELRNKKCYILFHHQDCVGWQFNIVPPEENYWITFKNLIKEYNIESDRFGFIFHEIVLNEDKWKVKNNVGLDIFYHNRNAIYTYCPDNFAKTSDVDRLTLTKLFNNTKGYYRQFKYCSHNNNIKDHRVELLLFLIKNDLLDDGVWSWFGGNEPIDQGVNQLDFTNFESAEHGKIDYTKEYGKEVVDIAHDLIPNSYDYKIDGLQDYLNVLPYFNSYFNIVTESVWGPGYDNTHPQKIHITEKVWKCMTTFQPFVLISNKNNLKKLREWGFKTFDGWIDESYDELNTYEERKKVINKEILRLCNMSRKELDKWYWEMEDILVHNFDNFPKFINSEYNNLQKMFENGWNKI
jgi:hypothetical protein